jgi:hypothetical protein
MTGSRALHQKKGERVERAVTQVLRNAGLGMSDTRRGRLVSVLGVDRRVKFKCKTRANGFRELCHGLDDANLLIVGADQLPPLAVIRLGFAIEIMRVAENSRKRVSSVPDAVPPVNRAQEAPLVMNSESKTPNALMPVDGFDDTADATASPLRGIGRRYYSYSEQFDTKGRSYAVIDKADGWQKLSEGIPPEYLMRQPGSCARRGRTSTEKIGRSI